MAQFRPILIASIGFTAIAAVMWALAIGWGAAHVYMTAQLLDRSGAIAATAVAGIWWAVLVAVLVLIRRDDERYRRLDGEYRRREAALIKTVGRLTGIPTPTRPLPRLRPVRR